jgi:hypothetical protein
MLGLSIESLTLLSREDLNNFKKFSSLSANSAAQCLALTHLGAQNLSLIMKWSYNDIEFRELCESSRFSAFWKAQLIRQVGDFAVLQPLGISPFTALTGYFFHNHYKECLKAFDNEITTAAIQLLVEACKSEVFVALKSYLDKFSILLDKHSVQEDDFQTCLAIAKKISLLHWMPGCVEAALLYEKIGYAIVLQDQHNKDVKLAAPFLNGLDSKIYFKQVLTKIFLAEKLSASRESERVLKNAWPGKSFNEVYGHIFTSWEDTPLKFKAKYNLSVDEYEIARTQAKTEFRNITRASLQQGNNSFLENTDNTSTPEQSSFSLSR